MTGSWPAGTPAPSTPWVAYTGVVQGGCRLSGGASWLQVAEASTAGGKAPALTDSLGPTWGLHLVDVNIALGDLVDLLGQESAARR